MANRGDTYTIELKQTHLEWGTHRYTNSRDRIYGEGYIPIPSNYAEAYEIKNSNATDGRDILGVNIFYCQSVDGHFQGILKSQGSSYGGCIYAKNFSAQGDLQAIGDWFFKMNAQIGDLVRVTWLSPTDIEIELLQLL